MVLKRISIDGGELAVEVTGSGPLVICYPGMGDTKEHYSPLASTLSAQGYTVATVDPRGHGDSSVFSTYGDEASASDFLAVMRELGATKAVLAGTSFGAAAATIAAAREPDAVVGIILLGPFLRNGAGKLVMSLFPLFFWKPWGPAMWKYYAATLWPGLGSDGASQRAKESTQSLTRPGRWAAFQSTVASLDHSVVAPYIPKVKAAALVVMGDKDPDWSKPAEEAEWVASQFKSRELLMVQGAGHGPAVEKPDVVGPAVVEFLAGLKKQGSF